MTSRPENPRLDAYLDGLMSPDERKAFEADAARSPEIDATISLQRRIDQTLAREFAHPPMARVPDALVHAARLPGASRRRSRRRAAWLVASVGVALVLAGVWAVRRPQPVGPEIVQLAPNEVHQSLVEGGFAPANPWNSGAGFSSALRERFACVVTFGPIPDGVEVLGWSDASAVPGMAMSPNSLFLLARVDGRDVVVAIDHRRDEAAWSRTSRLCVDGLNDFRREVDDLVLHEVSPFEHEAVTPLIHPSGE